MGIENTQHLMCLLLTCTITIFLKLNSYAKQITSHRQSDFLNCFDSIENLKFRKKKSVNFVKVFRCWQTFPRFFVLPLFVLISVNLHLIQSKKLTLILLLQFSFFIFYFECCAHRQIHHVPMHERQRRAESKLRKEFNARSSVQNHSTDSI